MRIMPRARCIQCTCTYMYLKNNNIIIIMAKHSMNLHVKGFDYVINTVSM